MFGLNNKIKIGDKVKNKSTFPNLNEYFPEAGIVLGLSNGPEYAGGAFVNVKLHTGKEKEFYLSALIKI